MPEPTLTSLTVDELRAEVGDFLGYGRGAAGGDAAWTTLQSAKIDSCVASGLHKFYFPPVLPGDATAHEWSFLRPTADLALASGADAALLPADFAGLTGAVAVTSPTGRQGRAIRQVNPVLLDLEAARGTATGAPELVAVRPLRGVGRAAGQRFELAVWPAADQAYTLRLAYQLAPDMLTAANPYPYGGPTHRETLLEACLSVAEARLDDALGLHTQLFVQHLQASVSHDRKFREHTLGYNADREPDPLAPSNSRRWPTTTLAGLTPE